MLNPFYANRSCLYEDSITILIFIRLFWNPGWHICSVCQKSAHYRCYTCPYSLCKGCTKGADYVCVRGDKGFCMACMKTIKLIEDMEQGNKELVCVTIFIFCVVAS